MGYIETVTQSKNLTIKHDGKNIRVPPHVFKMAKTHAFNVIGIYGDLKINATKDQDKAFKEAFEGYLEGYYESMYPSENPKNRAKAASKEFDLLSENSKFFTASNFPGLSPEQLKQKQNAFKSGVFNLNDAFLEGIMGKNRTFAMPYASGSKKPDTKKQKINRYYQLMSVCWILSFCEKMMALHGSEIEGLLKEKFDSLSEADLNSPAMAQKFVLSIKSKMNSELSKINLLDTLK